MTIEEEANTSWYWDKTSVRIVERLGKEDVSPSAVLQDGLKALESQERLKQKVKDLESGNGNVVELVNMIKEL